MSYWENVQHKLICFKGLQVALKQLEPFIRNGEHLQTGKAFKWFDNLRSRELLANWLLCVVGNFMYQAERLTFISDPTGGDGIICDTQTEETWQTEHVMVPFVRGAAMASVEELILNVIEKKNNKGGIAYASGKVLVVFLNAGSGEMWYPNKVARQLPEPLDFEGTYVIGLQHAEATGEYVYAVTQLNLSQGDAPTWCVRIASSFDAWAVWPVQGIRLLFLPKT